MLYSFAPVKEELFLAHSAFIFGRRVIFELFLVRIGYSITWKYCLKGSMTLLPRHDLTRIQARFLLALGTDCDVILLTEFLFTMASTILLFFKIGLFSYSVM